MKTIKVKHRLLKAMSLIEYAVLLAVVGVAVLGMSVYIKRAVLGRWKQGMDIFGFGRQYDPFSTGRGATPGPTITPAPTVIPRPTITPSPTPIWSPTPTPIPAGPTTFVPSGTLPVGVPGTVTVMIPTSVMLTPGQTKILENAGIFIGGRSDYDPPDGRFLEQSTTGFVSQVQRDAIIAVQNSI